MLTALHRVDGRWVCECECGGLAHVLAGNLKKGNSRSCGCARRATCSKRMASLNLRHGDTGSKEHQTWIGIIKRTTRPSSHRWNEYGKAGIGVCDRWLSYENFLADMGRAPDGESSIDRIDNTKSYSPENCRWATPSIQAQNRSTNRYTVHNGSVVCFAEAARRMGVSRSTIGRMAKEGRIKEVPYQPGMGEGLYEKWKPARTKKLDQKNSPTTASTVSGHVFHNF